MSDFDLIAQHIGHRVVVVGYGLGAVPPWDNAAVECEDCGCVIFTEDRPVDCTACTTCGHGIERHSPARGYPRATDMCHGRPADRDPFGDRPIGPSGPCSCEAFTIRATQA